MSLRFSNAVGSTIWFMRLWLGVALVMAMLAFLEMAFLAATGYRYRSKEYVEHVSLHDLSIVDLTHRAGVFHNRQRDASKPITACVKLHDGAKIPHSIQILDVEPHRIALSRKRNLAVSSPDGVIYLRKLPEPPRQFERETRLTKLFATNDKSIGELVFSPDGRTLAASGRDQLWLWDTDSRERIELAGKERLLSFFADSKRVLTTPRAGILRVRDLYSPNQFRDIRVNDSPIVAAAVSPNSQLILCSNANCELFAWSLASHGLLWKRHNTSLPREVAISDEFAAFVGSNGKDVVICNACSGLEPRVVTQHKRPIHGIAFIGQSQLLSWDVRGRVRAFDLGNANPCSRSGCLEKHLRGFANAVCSTNSSSR